MWFHDDRCIASSLFELIIEFVNLHVEMLIVFLQLADFAHQNGVFSTRDCRIVYVHAQIPTSSRVSLHKLPLHSGVVFLHFLLLHLRLLVQSVIADQIILQVA